ncbi:MULTISPECIES: hypothetical protein [unclassified Lactococcus]|uniref:hypothetical protein n=1 Tax=unclassified Lactococcus TaxID=2643510 RepID=UPI0011C9A8E1|nr:MULTISPECIES: hypothetical protein [unclassified Lactococcus]MQW22943.1 hypothetical protein [Lactococcus sp. dk101]TXK44510.1 hypothetical protein FVP42_04460 [Lactococcus sp. dk310]TXK50363.1 hypothetical protein FVP43_04430 [Lactococcus sp. dk322]
MEKTIDTGEVKIRLASNAATPLRYKMQFHTDYFGDLMKLAKSLDTGSEGKFDLSDVSWESLATLDLTLLYNFVWIYAKTADASLPEPLEWLDSLDSLPIDSFSTELQDLIAHSIQSKKK